MWSMYLVAIVVVLLCIWLQRRRAHFRYFQKRGIDGPKPNLLFGNAIDIWRKSQPTCFREWQEKYGDVYGHFNGAIPCLMVCDTEIIKEILVKRFSLFVDRGSLFGSHSHRNSHLAALTGRRWRRVRSTLTPSFAISKLRAVSESVLGIVDEFQQVLEKAAASNEDLNLHKVLQALTTDVICRIGMGINYGVIKDPDHPIMNRLQSSFRLSYGPPFIFLASFPSFAFLIPTVLKLLEIFQNKSDYMKNPNELIMKDCSKVIQMRRQNPQAKRSDLLQLLLDARYQDTKTDEDLSINDETDQKQATHRGMSSPKSGSGLTDKEVLENAWLIMLAGYETTANTLTSLSYVLMRKPEIQMKLRQELQENVPDKNNIDFEVVQKLPYMDAVIKETLRVYSPAILLSRKALQDVDLPKGLSVRKGELIVIPIKAVHMKEEYFENATEFRPERFLNGEVDMMAFQPFGSGPRNCIGMRFAQMEIKLTLTKLLLNYELHPTAKTPERLELAAALGVNRFDGAMYARVKKI